MREDGDWRIDDTLYIVAVAVGEAMDTLAAAVAVSVIRRNVTAEQIWRLTLSFGLFQAGMTVLGWFAGKTVEPWISSWDHWLAFAMLAAIGGKAVWHGWTGNDDDWNGKDPTRGFRLLILSIATSVDALAVGVSFGVMESEILIPATVIGGVTVLFTLIGAVAGSVLGRRFGRGMAILGGVILIALGAKIVVDHMA